jgi:uncharacterized protein (TIGR03067 family)
VEEWARDDMDRLQGAWNGVVVEREGRVVYRGAEARKAKVTFTADTAIFEDADVRLVGTFRLNPKRTPKTFDLTVAEGDAKETYPAGIYQVNDDTFKLCFAFPTAERPDDFATYPGSGRTLFVYKRAGSEARADLHLLDHVRLGSHVDRTERISDDRRGHLMQSQPKIGPGMRGRTEPLFIGLATVASMVMQTAPSQRAAELPAKKT